MKNRTIARFVKKEELESISKSRLYSDRAWAVYDKDGNKNGE